MHRQTLISHSDITRTSLHTWKATRALFEEFTEVYCSFTYGLRTYELAFQETLGSNYRPIGAPGGPSLVLIDANGAELWLGGCKSGYMGEGVSGTGYILRAEGFSAEHINLIPYAEHLQLKKDEREPVLFVQRPEKTSWDRTLSRHLEQLDVTGYFKHMETA